MTNMVSNCVYLESLMFLEVMVMLLEVIVMLLEVTQQVVYRAARAAKNKSTHFVCINAFCELKISRL